MYNHWDALYAACRVPTYLPVRVAMPPVLRVNSNDEAVGGCLAGPAGLLQHHVIDVERHYVVGLAVGATEKGERSTEAQGT